MRVQQSKFLKLLRREFGLRDDKNNIPFGYVDSGSDADYRQRITAVRQILNGNAGKLIEELTVKMDAHSDKLEYENAARHRDLIKAIRPQLANTLCQVKCIVIVIRLALPQRET